jgi:hypothetical protein
MKFAAAIILSLSIFLFACATYPKSPEDQAAWHVNQARAAISEGFITTAAGQIDIALGLPTGDTKIKELFAIYPKDRDYYRTYLEKSIADVSSSDQANVIFEKLSTAKSAGIFPEEQVRELFAKLLKVVTDGNTTGSIPFDLGDQIDLFPVLSSPVHQQIIVNRTINILQDCSSGNRPVAALMECVQRVGVDSAEGKRIEFLLPTMNIRCNELDVVAKVFPKFAATRKEEITARVFVQFKNGDRLLSEDILDALRNRVRGVEWVTSDGPNIITVVIDRARNDEKTLPERTETITYATHEVNMVSAILLMPRNASYLYEVVSGGAEIEYGYVVSAFVDGKSIYDEVVRGRVGGEYRRCQNARIQNVFGGVSSAGFVANDDMQRRCSGPSSASIENLRKDVFSKVVDGVLKVPPVKVVHELN